MKPLDLNSSYLTLEDVVKLSIPFAVAAALLFEVSYFAGLGVGISRAPLSPSDYLTGWTEWSSVGLYFFIGMFVNIVIFGRIENWKSEEELIASSSNPERLRRFRQSPIKLFLILFLSMGLLFLGVGEINLVAFLPVLFVGLLALCVWLAQGSHLEDQLRNSRIQVLIATLIICCINGFSQGTNVLDRITSTNLSMQIGSTQSQVIRIFDQWTLVRVDAENLAWVSNQSDRKIDFKPERTRFVGVYCFYQWHLNDAKPRHCSRYW